ncbi:MAG: acetyl-CoA C-acyltransferase [Burkholderiaceae bacterium]
MHIPVYICDAVRTPFAYCGEALSALRPEELAAVPLMALMVRNPHIDWEQLNDVLFGCAYPSIRESGSASRASNALADLPPSVPGMLINRLYGSGMDAVGSAARFIKSGEVAMMVASGVDSLSHAKGLLSSLQEDGTASPASKNSGFGRLENMLVQLEYGGLAMTESVERLAREFNIERRSQDRYAYASHRKAYAAQQNGYFDEEITPVTIAQKNGDPSILTQDGFPSRVSSAALAGMEALIPEEGTVTKGNSAPAGDGACALLLANENTAHKYSLMPKARVLGMAVVSVPLDAMAIAAAAAGRKVLVQTGLAMDEISVIELNEAYAAQAIAVLRDWGLQDDDPRVNPNGGALTFGQPPGATGARMVLTAMHQLHRAKERYALCAMCAGAGQGIALIIERV